MKFTSLDAITRSKLLQKGLPIHYYLRYLKHATDCFRELHYDTLKVVNSRKLPVNGYGAVDLPCDYVDFVKVGIPSGQVVRRLVNDGSINRLVNLDAQGQKTIWGGGTTQGGAEGSAVVHTDDNGSQIGRYFGYNDGLLGDTFKVLPERNQIQLGEALGVDHIILEYVSDGTYTDAATRVDPLAKSTIEAYQEWKVSPNANNPYSPEAKLFDNEWRKLRARKNPLTPADIRRILRAATNPTIK